MNAIAATMLLLFGTTPSALAWGSEGHRIAAEIAEQYLEADTASQVRELLALEGATALAEVSTWADEILPLRRDTAPWHFVHIPIHPPAGTPRAYDSVRDCPGGDCVVAAIERFTAVLHDKEAPPTERLEALKFVVHFIADIHQPLHCADDGDHSGSDTHISFLGQDTTLYALWDSGMLAAVGINDERAYASRLVKAMPPARVAQWRAGTVVDWANESYGIGRLIYGSSHEARALEIFYEEDFLPVINVQLEKAGLRLAMVLNRAMRT